MSSVAPVSFHTPRPADEHATEHRPDLRHLLHALGTGGDGEQVSLGELIETLGAASANGALLVVALLALSPATVVFGVASVCGCAIALISAQKLVGRKQLWVPAPVRRLRIRTSGLMWLAARLRTPFLWLERRTRPRLSILTEGKLARLPYAIGLPMGCAMPLLELVPLSATSAGAAISLMTLGIFLKDGLVVLAGVAACVGVAIVMAALGFGAAALIVTVT